MIRRRVRRRPRPGGDSRGPSSPRAARTPSPATASRPGAELGDGDVTRTPPRSRRTRPPRWLAEPPMTGWAAGLSSERPDASRRLGASPSRARAVARVALVRRAPSSPGPRDGRRCSVAAVARARPAGRCPRGERASV